jgi:glucose/arabinose dehydrogenase
MKKSLSKVRYEKKLLLFLIFFLISTLNFAQILPDKFSGTQIEKGLDPVGMDIAPDGRIFLAEKNGKIRVVKNDKMLPTPLITIKVNNDSERGLMKVLVDPDFKNNGYIYAFYTRKSGDVINNRVSRFTVDKDKDVASASSELVLIDIDSVDGTTGFHNGGGLVILKGQIYISTGESTVASNSQSLNTLKGKILRLNTDGTIPTDNPFYNTAKGVNRAIWALGLRNPFRLSVQNGTDKIFATDVGGGNWEEINEILKGKNYGWPGIEGKRVNQTPPNDYKDPFFAYNHSNGACSITAGTFYSPSTTNFPSSYQNRFFYADYCAGWIKTINPSNGTLENFASDIANPLDVAVDNSNGVLYFIARGSRESNTSSSSGVLWKVTYTGNGIPQIAVQPNNTTVSVGQNVSFKVSASGSPAPTYQWQRNGQNISGATASTYTISNTTLADNGAKFKVKVSNSAGSVTSNEVTLSVIDNKIPEPTIVSPSVGTKYVGGNIINFSATATDKEDGDLPASAFTWKIELFHFDNPEHFHPAMDNKSGIKSGTFTIPTDMETSPNVLFRIFLTVVDSKGASKTISRDVTPTISKINLVTNPPGLKLKLDGVVVTSPYSFDGAKGINRAIEASSPQTLNGTNYVFSSWSDKGARVHTISTPDNGFTYTANFVKSTGGGGGGNVGGIVSGTIYEMEPQHEAGQRLDVRGGNAANGTLVDMFQRHGGLNQQFKFINISGDLYYIEPQSAVGKVLGVVGESTLENALVDIFDNRKQANQRWRAIPVEGEPQLYRFEPQNAIGKRLDIELINGNQSAASRTLDNGRSQRWKLIPVPKTNNKIDNIGLDLNEESQFFAHPNPFINKTKIALPAKNIKDATKTVEIYNLQGQVLRVIDVSSNESGDFILERNNLESGVYIYAFKINDVELYSKKMVIVD